MTHVVADDDGQALDGVALVRVDRNDEGPDRADDHARDGLHAAHRRRRLSGKLTDMRSRPLADVVSNMVRFHAGPVGGTSPKVLNTDLHPISS